MITGILPVDKPLGWTSHDAVARVRRVAGQKAVGHAGTLDPLATGVLLVVLGRATRLSSYLMEGRKEYRAVIVLGATTVTDDGEAPLQMAHEVGEIPRGSIEAAVARFVGTIDQVPPRYAAVRKGGEKLYTLARRGVEVELEPRQVTIDEIAVERWECPLLQVRVRCGAGTYIRSLARDIGAALDTGAYLHGLRRTASGSFRVENCIPLARLEDRPALLAALQPADRAVIHWPAMALPSSEAHAITQGRAIALHSAPRGSIRLYSEGGELLALGEHDGEWIKPFRVFAGGQDAAGR